MDTACQICGLRDTISQRKIQFERRSGASKTIRMQLCSVCADSLTMRDWVRELRR